MAVIGWWGASGGAGRQFELQLHWGRQVVGDTLCSSCRIFDLLPGQKLMLHHQIGELIFQGHFLQAAHAETLTVRHVVLFRNVFAGVRDAAPSDAQQVSAYVRM